MVIAFTSPRPDQDVGLPRCMIYADDIDFISMDVNYLAVVENVASIIFAKWNLTVNIGKTEKTSIQRYSNRLQENWRGVRKLGSLIGDYEDVARRKQLAIAGFRKLYCVWLRHQKVSERVRLRLYNAFIRPILLYNCGTWGLTTAQMESVDSFHRKQLRMILRIFHPVHISNSDLYKRCNSRPISIDIFESRWKLFGHNLRLDINTPVQLAMRSYFIQNNAQRFRGRSPINLPITLKNDLSLYYEQSGKYQKWRIELKHHLDNLRKFAINKDDWRKFVKEMTQQKFETTINNLNLASLNRKNK
jgi:hypothetical protein